MRIEYNDLQKAVDAKLITETQANSLWAFWQNEQKDVPQFQLSHVLYYFGGLLAISAVTLFVTSAWGLLRGFPLLIISSGLFLLGLLLTRKFLNKKLLIPAGIMSTFSLAVVPLAVYNLQLSLGILPPSYVQYADYHSLIAWFWVPMELATLLVGAVMLYFYQFPFLLFPLSFTLWYMSMDLFALWFQSDTFIFRSTFSLWFGLLVICLAIYMDFKHSDRQKDYGFWLYIVGVLTFWGGLTCHSSAYELNKLIYCLINIAMILASVFLNRRVFAVFGVLGVLGYLGHLAFSLFANSLIFPLVLVFLGFMLIWIAARWNRVEHRLIEYFKPYIPEKILRRANRR